MTTNDSQQYMQWLLEFIARLYPNSSHLILNEANETLRMSLHHHSHTVRLIALQRVKEVLVDAHFSEEVLTEFVGRVVERAEDKHIEVAISAIRLLKEIVIVEGGSESLLSHPATLPLLFRALQNTPDRVGIESVYEEDVFSLILSLHNNNKTLHFEKEMTFHYIIWLSDFLLIRSDTLSFSLLAIRHALHSSHPFFSHLSRDTLTTQLDELQRMSRAIERKKGNKVKEGDLHTLTHNMNTALLHSFALALCDENTRSASLQWIESLLFSNRPLVVGREGIVAVCFAFLVVVRALQHTCESHKKPHSEFKDISHIPDVRFVFHLCSLLLGTCSRLFSASILSKKGKDEEIAQLQREVGGEETAFLHILSLIERHRSDKIEKKKTTVISSLLLFVLNSAIRYLPKDTTEDFRPCHLLRDADSCITLLTTHTNTLDEYKLVLTSLQSILYIFLLSAPSIATFLPQFHSLISLHLRQKFLKFNAMFYTSPMAAVFLENEQQISSSPSHISYELTYGNWRASPVVPCRCLSHVMLYFSGMMKRVEGSQKKKTEASKQLDIVATILPSLIVACGSSHSVVRKCAIDCVGSLRTQMEKFRTAFGNLTTTAIQTTTTTVSVSEIEHICSQMPRLTLNHLSEKEESFVLHSLQSYFESPEKGFVYAASAIHRLLLDGNPSPRLLPALFPIAKEIVHRLQNTNHFLYFYLYAKMLRSFVSFVIPILSSDSSGQIAQNCFVFFLDLLASDSSTLYSFKEPTVGVWDEKVVVPSSTDFSLPNLISSSLTPEIFEKFSDERKQLLLLRLCQLAYGREVVCGAEMAKELLTNFSISPYIFANTLTALIPGPIRVANEETTKKKKKVGKDKDALSLPSNEIQSRLQNVVYLLTSLNTQEKSFELKGTHKLITALFTLLSVLIQHDNPLITFGVFPFAVRLALTSTCNLLSFLRTGSTSPPSTSTVTSKPEQNGVEKRKSGKEGKKLLGWKQICGPYFQMDSLVDFFTTTTDTHTNNLALLLIAEIARGYPQNVLKNITSIFTYMGSESLRRDDNYTFIVIQHAIEALVPAVMCAEGCGIETVISLFVDAVEHIPQHRRLLLFAMFIRVVKMESLHHILLQMLIKSTRSSIPQNQQTNAFVFRKFLIELCLQFSPLHISRALAKLFHILLHASFTDVTGSGQPNVVSPPSFTSPQDFDLLQKKVNELDVVGRRALRVSLMHVASDYFTNESVLEKLLSIDRSEDRLLHFEYLHLFHFCLIQLRQFPTKSSHQGFIADTMQLPQKNKVAEKKQRKEEVSESDSSSDESDSEEDSEAKDSEDPEDPEENSEAPRDIHTSLSDIQVLSNSQYFADILSSLTVDFIDTLNELMPINAFTRAVTELLRYPDSIVRQNALQMLNEKILKSIEYKLLNDEHIRLFLSMVGVLISMIRESLKENREDEIDAEQDAEQDGDEKSKADHFTESAINIQTALLSLEILARHFGFTHSDHFIDSLQIVAQCTTHSSVHVASSAVISFATHCAELRAKSLPALNKTMPMLLEIAKVRIDIFQTTNVLEENSQLQIMSILSALEVLFMTISKYLTPFLGDVLGLLTQPFLCVGGSASRKLLMEKSEKILQHFSKNVDARHVFSSVIRIFSPDTVYRPQSLTRLIRLIGEVIDNLDPPAAIQHRTIIFKFFLEIFDYRKKVAISKLDIPATAVEKVENAAISSFISLVVKLNEVAFKPLFLMLLDWAATPNTDVRLAEHGTSFMADIANTYRARFFFALVSEMSSKLKSIFSPFYLYILDHMLSYITHDEYINGPKEPSKKQKKMTRDQKFDELNHKIVCNVVECYTKLFLFDNGEVVQPVLFNKIVGPLVTLVQSCSRRTDTKYNQLNDLVTPCLVQLAAAINNDIHWKTLNHQILLLTRHSLARVRCGAIQVQMEMYNKLGEEYLILLPESVSYFSELMEDSDQNVESACRRLLKKIDSLLGDESIRDYF
jgi:hypothetical protein